VVRLRSVNREVPACTFDAVHVLLAVVEGSGSSVDGITWY
jgi:hypothetical protein